MNVVSTLLKIIANLGQISSDFSDFETVGKDLFAGKLSEAEIASVIADVVKILSSGLIAIPGVDSNALVSAITASQSLVSDVIVAVADIKSGTVPKAAPDAKALASDLLKLVESNLIQNFGGYTRDQASDLLNGIIKQL